MIPGGPMTRLLAGRTFWMLVGLLALIEAVFVAEIFTGLLSEVIRNGGSAVDVAVLLLLEAPEIVDFALPIVLLIGLYFAINAARRDNELVVCAAAGVPWTRLPVFAFWAGVIAFAVSLLFAGVLTPLGKYTQRLALYQLEARAVIAQLTDPGPRSALHEIRGRTIIATLSDDPKAERGNLFIYHPESAGGWRVSQADDWSVEGPDDDDGYSVRLKAFRDYAGSIVPDGGADPEQDRLRQTLDFATIDVRNLSMDFRVEQVMRAIDTARREGERMVFAGAADTAQAVRLDRRTGEILARALLCIVAALVAVAAAAWSATPAGRFAALPVALFAVLTGDIVGRALLGGAAAQGLAAFLAMAAICTGIGIGLPLIYVLRRGELVIAPGRDR